jgi:ankyrin repeat protein/beta-lactamase regulating signal transducer with metallopeptidase domain
MTTAFAGFPPLLLVLTLASTTAVSLAALAALLLRRHSAALRHFLWLLALATPLVALPLYRFHPYLDLKVLPPAPIRIAPALPANDPAPLQITPPESSPANAPLPPPPTLPTQLIFLIESWNPWLVAWTLGALIIAARILLAHAHVRRLLRTHSGWAPAELLTRLHEASAFFHLGRAPHLRISPLIEIPLCHGLLRPTVLFPESWREWNSERIDICLTHELAHLRRRDLAAMALGQAACLLCWFNPLVWLAAARLRDEAENAADDLVLARNIRPETYAANLVALTEKFRASALAPTIALSMARPNRLRSRIESILDATLLRRAPNPRLLLALALSAAALLLLAMSLRLTAQETKPATNIVTNPPIYIQFDGISAGFFGPVHGDASISDNSRVPGTNFKLSVSCKSYTATKANLVFVAEKPNGPAEKQLNGQTLQPIDSKSEEVSVTLGQVAHFKIFGQIDVTASPTLTLPAPAAPAQLSGPDKQMFDAVRKGDAATVQELISQGVDPNKVQDRGQPLIFAAGSPDVVKILLQHGANPNARNSQNDSALCFLLRNHPKESVAIARVLLEHGADPNIRSGEMEETPLMDAPDGATVDLLIQHGADIHLKMTNGSGVLDIASNHALDYFQSLLRHGIPFDAKKDGPTLLLRASWTSNLPIMQEMIDRGVDPNVEGVWAIVNGKPDLMLPIRAAAVDNQTQAAKFLLAHGAKADEDMVTALHNRNEKIVKLFWESGVRNISELCYQISQGAPIGVLQKLLDAGVPANPPQDTEITPLGEAAQLGNLEAVKLLIAHQADVNARDRADPNRTKGWEMTPLCLAAAEGQDEVVAYLLQNGATPDPEAVYQAGFNSFPYSEQRSKDHFEKTVRILIDAGAVKNITPDMAGLVLAGPLGTRQGPPNPTVLKMLLDAGLSPDSPMAYLAENGEPPNTVIGYYRDYYQKRKGDPVYAEQAAAIKPLLDLLEAADKSAPPKSDSGAQPSTTDPAALQKQMLEAACKGDIKTVDALLAQGVNVNDPAFSQTTGRTLLGNVATVGQTEMINYLADHGADLNAKDKSNNVALTYALNFGKDDAACALIAHGADFNVSDRSNPNAAWIAASMFYCPDALQLMMQKGVNVLGTDPRGENIISHISHFGVLSKSHPSYFGGTPYSDVVQKAYEAREQRVVELLLAAGVDANGRDGTETPLMTMLRSNHFAAARALLDHGVNLTFKDADGNTALAYLFSWSGRNEFPLDILDTLLKEGANPNTVHHWPAQPPESVPLLEEAIGLATHQENLIAYPQAVKMLLDHGATFFGVTDYKVQDLLRAAARGDLPAIQKAVQEGAGINAASGSGWTALAISTSLGYDDCTNWLLAQGADVNARAGKRWWDPLTFAVARGQADLVDTLIAKGAKPTWGDGGISSAVQQNNQRIFDALIKAGADPKPVGLSTITIGNISYHPIDNLPLYTCIKNGQTAMALTLLEKGADPEPQGPRDNQNLAYFAVQYNRPEILQALLNHGANPTLKDSHGESPLDLAQKSHPNLVPMLQAAAANGPHADAAPASGNSNVGAASSYPNKKDIIATTYWNAKTPGPFYAALPFNDLANPDAAEKWLPSSWATAASTGPQPRSACLGHWLKITNQAGASCYAQWEDFGPGADTDPDYVFGNQPPKNAQAPALDLSPAAAQFLGLDDKHKTVAWQFIDQKDVPPGPWLPAHPNTPATTP